MNLNKTNAFLVLAALCRLSQCAASEATDPQRKETAVHEYIIVSVGLALFLLAVFLFWQGLQQQKKVEFTVFNSQYIGKESVRSSSEHDFPNFDLDIFKNNGIQQEEGEQRSSERRRRRRKIDRLQKNGEVSNKGETAPQENLG